MLTSSLIAPNALNLKLHGRTKSTTTQQSNNPDVAVKRDGTYTWNGRRVSKGQLETEMRKVSRSSNKSFTISPHKQTPVENVVYVMDLAMRLNLEAVLSLEK